jgi:hypothetical protein
VRRLAGSRQHYGSAKRFNALLATRKTSPSQEIFYQAEAGGHNRDRWWVLMHLMLFLNSGPKGSVLASPLNSVSFVAKPNSNQNFAEGPFA